eukprot:Partr_v1_DN28990_c1_g1_i2_m25623 putative Cysteinyl-tRNA synthetase
MSKSLKNFVTIREALSSYTSNQIRYMFLMHQWDSVLDYKASSMEAAISAETTFKNFVQNVNALKLLASAGDKQEYASAEAAISALFFEKQGQVHDALVDSMNTPVVISQLLNLVNKVNSYVLEKDSRNIQPNVHVLDDIASYIQRMLNIFGIMETSNAGKSDNVMPYLQVLGDFRAKVRDMAKSKVDHVELLKECDVLRDKILPEVGVILEDKGGKTLLKFGTLKLDDKKKDEEEAKLKAKKKAADEEKRKQAEKLEKGKIPAKDMFRTSEYSQWDAEGMPTHDAANEELTKSRKKKLAKEYQMQEKLHALYLKSIGK